jgi:RNA recognition motif-containing protein
MNLYVSNLSYAMTDEELQAEFSAFGNVSGARVVKDRESGRSRGFGFVEMPVESEALTATNALNGKEVGGRPLRVVEARPKEERPPPRNPGGGGKRDQREDWDRDKRS